MTLFLRKLTLSQFRCYDAARLEFSSPETSPFVVLTGSNGAGKTNILEAISLLVPGRGLRNADLLEIKNRNALPQEGWGVAGEVTAPDGHLVKLGTGLLLQKKKRSIRIDGKDAKNQTQLAQYMSAVWLTPQMDRLFLDGPSARRKFIDRLVFAFDPAHVGRVNRYDLSVRERMKVMEQHGSDATWLAALEKKIAETAVAIATSRLDLVHRLQQLIDRQVDKDGLFPLPDTVIEGPVENLLQEKTALAVEEELCVRFKQERSEDLRLRRTQTGTHRSDLLVYHKEHGMPANQCSTGEQKGLLVSLTLAHASLMAAEKGYTPVLLLDEVAAHLDEKRRLDLFSRLKAMKAQVFLTGTDQNLFASLGQDAQFFDIENGRVRENVQIR